MVAANTPGNAAFGRALVELLIIAAPVVAGLYALRSGANARLAFALIWIGFAWSLTSLGQSSASVPYTIGRLSVWLIFPGVVYLLLAFPLGRIAPGLDRALFVLIVAVTVVLFYGTAPLVQAYPPKTLWATCTTDCPANAVFFLHVQPAFLVNLVRVRDWLAELLWLGLFWSMFRRWRHASPLQRRAMSPVFVAGALLGLVHISFITYRQLDGPTDRLVALSSAWTLCIVAVCAAILFGLFRRRMLLGQVLAHLSSALRENDSPAAVRDALATALSDPSLELLFHDPDLAGWQDANGQAQIWPRPLPARQAATPITAAQGGEDLVLVHDSMLRDDEELLDGVAGIVLAVEGHERLIWDLEHAMSDLESSRRRIAEAADHERARIERDLHDGAQQRLVALRIQLSQVAERLQTDPGAARAQIDELGAQTDLAIDELRLLAQGVYPSLLADLGLTAALQGLALHNPLPVRVAAHGISRYAMEVESAVYFTCVEAVQNAMKHATGATAVWIDLAESHGMLHFEVRDDGAGMPPHTRSGQGMRNMRDRIEALSGHLTIASQPGRGTRITAAITLLPTSRIGDIAPEALDVAYKGST